MTKVKFITKSDFTKEKSINELKVLWPKLTLEEKEFVFECLIFLNPDSKKTNGITPLEMSLVFLTLQVL